jgi:hypothetical protein
VVWASAGAARRASETLSSWPKPQICTANI